MNKIKFSHEYPKLWGQTTATLISVKLVYSIHLHKDLLDYDTTYIDGKEICHYPLPFGALIHLTFLGDKNIPFCTIRRHTKQKMNYYSSKVNEEFEIVRVV